MIKINSSSYQLTQTVKGAGGPDVQAHWEPNTDVFLAEGYLVVRVELAGMKQEDLELAVEGNRLYISGRRLDGCRPNGCKFLVMEIRYGSFECVIDIPPGYNMSEARAAYQNGFLQVDVPASISISDPDTSASPARSKSGQRSPARASRGK